MALDVEVLGHAGEQALGKVLRRRWAARGNQRELIAAEAGEERAGGGFLEAAGHLTEERVADRMPEDVVDLLEAIEVDAQDGESFIGLGRLFARRLQMFRERRAVGKIGQRVV